MADKSDKNQRTLKSEAPTSEVQKSDKLEDEKTQIATIRQPLVEDDNINKWAAKTMYANLHENRQPYKGIFSEFKNYKDWRPPQVSTIFWKKRSDKNRYSDQPCMDQTRVILKERGPENDYINASWMKMPNNRRWICTQGPISESVEDFWHMIYTETSKVICMLCSFREDKVEKTYEYFNLDEKKIETFGPYKIRTLTKTAEVVPGLKYTVLEVQKKNCKITHTVHHLWHTTWPDHYCPLDASATTKMLKMALEKGGNDPIVVHCSAGIGRTGTFVGIDYGTQMIHADSDMKMIEVLFALRRMRIKSIQSQLQYAFLHQCIMEHFAQEGLLKRDEEFEKVAKCFEKFATRTIALQKAQKDRFYAEKAEKTNNKQLGTKDKAEEITASTPVPTSGTKRNRKSIKN